MGHTPEEVRKHIWVYFMVFGALAVLTAITVAVSYLHLPFREAVALALIIASIKAALVACYFMHLISEQKIITSVLLLTAFFLIVVFLLPLWTQQSALVPHVS